MHDIARYYPIVTTIFSFIIAWEMFDHYRQQKSTYLLCWLIGICTFGLAALAASIHVLAGWNPATLKSWYILGALFGGFPLAQGMAFYLMNRTFATISTIVFSIVIAAGAVAVALTPISIPPDFDYELTGKVFSWKWVRLISPIVNSYSFLLMFGAGLYSGYRFYKHPFRESPYLGTANIALGAILPGIGGILMRMGYVNALFVMEFLALVVIYSGYRIVKRSEL